MNKEDGILRLNIRFNGSKLYYGVYMENEFDYYEGGGDTIIEAIEDLQFDIELKLNERR